MIEDCGVLEPGESITVAVEDDGTGDNIPQYPEDADITTSDVSSTIWNIRVSMWYC